MPYDAPAPRWGVAFIESKTEGQGNRMPGPACSVLEGVPNLVQTPHIAGVTEEPNARISQMIADNVRDVLENVGVNA
ncbi:hypothetical protein [Halomonas sp.]|uniref:hypothetical protein n=1 Tax=Halomonas sp. TaxID=1486246 RepID=UPI003850B4D3